jgi:hypothetical protein
MNREPAGDSQETIGRPETTLLTELDEQSNVPVSGD